MHPEVQKLRTEIRKLDEQISVAPVVTLLPLFEFDIIIELGAVCLAVESDFRVLIRIHIRALIPGIQHKAGRHGYGQNSECDNAFYLFFHLINLP